MMISVGDPTLFHSSVLSPPPPPHHGYSRSSFARCIAHRIVVVVIPLYKVYLFSFTNAFLYACSFSYSYRQATNWADKDVVWLRDLPRFCWECILSGMCVCMLCIPTLWWCCWVGGCSMNLTIHFQYERLYKIIFFLICELYIEIVFFVFFYTGKPAGRRRTHYLRVRFVIW